MCRDFKVIQTQDFGYPRKNIDYDYKIPIKQLWIYWGQFDVCIGLNGLMYEISEQFARKLNQIMQKEANIVIFDSRWFEFLHKREVEGT